MASMSRWMRSCIASIDDLAIAFSFARGARVYGPGGRTASAPLRTRPIGPLARSVTPRTAKGPPTFWTDALLNPDRSRPYGALPMIEIDQLSEICDVGFDEGVFGCSQPASVIFHIGRDRQVTVARCAFHARNFRRALKATLRGISWMEQRLPVRAGVVESLTATPVLPC